MFGASRLSHPPSHDVFICFSSLIDVSASTSNSGFVLQVPDLVFWCNYCSYISEPLLRRSGRQDYSRQADVEINVCRWRLLESCVHKNAQTCSFKFSESCFIPKKLKATYFGSMTRKRHARGIKSRRKGAWHSMTKRVGFWSKKSRVTRDVIVLFLIYGRAISLRVEWSHCFWISCRWAMKRCTTVCIHILRRSWSGRTGNLHHAPSRRHQNSQASRAAVQKVRARCLSLLAHYDRFLFLKYDPDRRVSSARSSGAVLTAWSSKCERIDPNGTTCYMLAK